MSKAATCPYCFEHVPAHSSLCSGCGARKYWGSNRFEKSAYAALGAAFGLVLSVTFGFEGEQIVGATMLGTLFLTSFVMYRKRQEVRFSARG